MMTFQRDLYAQIETRVETSLRQIGLFPVWRPGVTLSSTGKVTVVRVSRDLSLDVDSDVARGIGDPAIFARDLYGSWPSIVRLLFKMGAVYLRDVDTDIAASVEFDSSHRVILRRSQVRSYTVLGDGPLLVSDSDVGPHCYLVGPVVLERTSLRAYNHMNRNVLIRDSFLASYAKAQHGVRVDRSLISAYAGMDGGTHPEQYPLNSEGVAAQGVVVGHYNWIGHHAALLAGTRTGDGVVVGSGVTLTRQTEEYILFVGNPARALPLDYHLRAVSAEAAFEAGRRQGAAAALLPIYGPPSARFTSPSRFEIDYPTHGVLRSRATDRLLDFQRGALTELFREIRPDVAFTIQRVAANNRVCFHIDFGREMEPTVRLSNETILHVREFVSGALPLLNPTQMRVYSLLQQAQTYGQLKRATVSENLDAGPLGSAALDGALFELSSRGLLSVRLLNWRYEAQHREDEILRALEVPFDSTRLVSVAPRPADVRT